MRVDLDVWKGGSGRDGAGAHFNAFFLGVQCWELWGGVLSALQHRVLLGPRLTNYDT